MLRHEHSLRFHSIFSSPKHKVLKVSYCDRSMSVVRRLSCAINNLLQMTTPPTPLGQFQSNFIGIS